MSASRRKAAIFALVGVLWLAMGAVVAITQDPIDPARAIVYEMMPTPVRVALWLGSGSLAVVALWVRPLRRFAPAALTVMVVEKVVGYGASALAFLVPGYPPGWAPALASMLSWGVVGGVLYLAAGLPEDQPARGAPHAD